MVEWSGRLHPFLTAPRSNATRRRPLLPRKREMLARAEKAAALIGALPAPERAALMRLAGYEQTKVGALLRRLLAGLEEKLGAERVERISVLAGRGQTEIREFTDIDWTARHRAIDVGLTLLGMYPSRNTGVSSEAGDLTINIMLPARPEPKPIEIVDVTPQP